MGLDATIYCDCFERGKLSTPPRSEWRLYIDDSGCRFAKTADIQSDLAFDRWNASACAHADGVLLHHWLGSIGGIGLLRTQLLKYGDQFSLTLSKVIYNGTHCGDHIPIAEIDELDREVSALSFVKPEDKLAGEWVRDFEKKMNELLTAARSVAKPISF